MSPPPPSTAWAPAGSVTVAEAAAGRLCPLPPSPAPSPHFFSCFLVPQTLLPRKNRSQSLVIKLVLAKPWQVSKQLIDDSPLPPTPTGKENKGLEGRGLDKAQRSQRFLGQQLENHPQPPGPPSRQKQEGDAGRGVLSSS